MTKATNMTVCVSMQALFALHGLMFPGLSCALMQWQQPHAHRGTYPLWVQTGTTHKRDYHHCTDQKPYKPRVQAWSAVHGPMLRELASQDAMLACAVAANTSTPDGFCLTATRHMKVCHHYTKEISWRLYAGLVCSARSNAARLGLSGRHVGSCSGSRCTHVRGHSH